MNKILLFWNSEKIIFVPTAKISIWFGLILSVCLLISTRARADNSHDRITPNITAEAVLSNVTVGTGGNYTTLKAAFDAINTGSITGIITIAIISNTTETATATLNSSGTGLANFTSVLIYPTGAGYEVTGNLNNPIINLDGADNVIIDGRINGAGVNADLTITNSNTGNSATALRLINSAEKNTIRYTTLKGSSLSGGSGVVYFATSTLGNGNNTNVIEYCNITNAGGNRPYNAIYSYGTAGRENSNNNIRLNKIFDSYYNNSHSNGINIAGNSSDWIITGNSLYETTSLAPTGNYTYNAIRIGTANMHTISSNFIGGSAPFCAGAPFTMNSAFATFMCGISITGNTSTPTLIQNNTIQNVNYSSTSANTWDGIYASGGNINFSGNTIGAATGINSVVLTAPNASAVATVSGGVLTSINLLSGGSGFLSAPAITFSLSGSTTAAVATAIVSGGIVTGFTINNGGAGYTSVPTVNINGANYSTAHGIRCLNSATVSVENNSIGGITTHGNTAYTHALEAIVISGTATTVLTVNNNLIGSLSTANSIRTITPAASSVIKQDLRGIFVNSAISLATIKGNTVANITNDFAGTSIASIDGICSTANSNIIQNNTIRNINSSGKTTIRGLRQYVSTTGTTQTITGNTIYNLTNTNTSENVKVIGIDYTGPISGTNVISGNFVHSLSIASSNILSEINGIVIGNGSTTTSNNIINLGANNNVGYKIIGINEISTASATNNNIIYFNSVYLSGAVTSTATSATFALWNTNNIATRNFRNNILTNVRSGGTAGKHYAIHIAGNTGLNIDYNNYNTIGGTFLGQFNTTDKTTLALWQLATVQDLNSLNTNPMFNTPGGTNPADYYTSAILPAATGTGIDTDYTGLARSAVPKMGALEITSYVWSGATSTNFSTASNWQNGLVPPNGSDISFAPSPVNNCFLDQNRSLRNVTNAQGTYKLVLNGFQLTLTGNLAFSNNAKIDATAIASVMAFAGTSAQIIPAGAFSGNILDGIMLNNPVGLTLNDNFTIARPFTLINGALTIGAHTLTLNGVISAVSGTITGGIKSNIIIGGSGTAGLPAVLVNNLTLSRATGATLEGSVTVAGTLALTSGILVVGENSMTISGNSPTIAVGSIDASHVNASLIFNNAAPLTIPSSFFTGNVNNLSVIGLGGITSSGDFTLNGILDLQNNNPSSIKGSLDMWDGSADRTITMGANATNIGLGDTTGIIKRTSFTAGVSYTLGSPFMKVFFNNTGTLPGALSLKLSIGTLPVWKAGAINREIEVIQTGAVATSGVVSYHYLDSELNGNNEENLVLWVKAGNIEYGGSAFNPVDNWVSLSNVNVAFFSSAFDDIKNVTLDEYSTNNTLTWNGSISDSWTTVQNWTPNVGPSATKNIIIPKTATTPFAALLPSVTAVKSIEIEAGGILNAVASAQLTIDGTNAWGNYGGTFNASTSTVIFNNAAATISGTTNFYNLGINSGKSLSMTENSNLRIAGVMLNNGTWNTLVPGSSFIEYNGAAQTISNPNGATPGYSTLILSGSGVKTINSDVTNIERDFVLNGAVTVTATSGMTIKKNLVIGQSSIFNVGNFDHSVYGDFDNSGTFTAATGHKIILRGASEQEILGSSSSIFTQLDIDNSNGVNTNNNVTVNELLKLTNGVFSIGPANLRISGNISKISGFIATQPLSSLIFSGPNSLVLNDDLFFAPPVLNNLTINRSGGITFGQNVEVNGVLNLLAGNLNIASSNLTLGAAATISVSSPNAAKMIIASGTGELRKTMSSGSSFTFPVGDNTGTVEYSPITISIADDGAAENYYGVRVINAKHPNNASMNQYLNRYWSTTSSGNNSHTATISANYNAADISGTEANISSAVLDGNFNQMDNPWVKANPLSANNLSISATTLTAGQTAIFTGIAKADPSVILTGATTTCSGSNVALNAVAVADGTVLYSWSPPDFLNSTTIANPIAVAVTATTTYNVTIKDGNGIRANATGTVTAGNTSVWTGSWSNGLPTATTAVIISADYTAISNLTCCSITVNNNAAVVIPSTFNVRLNGALIVSSGSFTLENNASLLQDSDTANSGNIIVKRFSSALMRQDYTLWSSPVANQQLLAFSTFTLPGRFYKYDSGTNLYAATASASNFENAKGYLIRMPNNHPTIATIWSGVFTGVPNNGNYSYAMNVGDSSHRFNLVGNPYPSPLSIEAFVSENTASITGTLYFWRKTNNAASPSYCSWAGGTFVSNGEAEVFDPNGILQTGQGFFVEAKANATSVSFTNTQRVSNSANQFFRLTDTDEQNRIWLNATDTSGAFSQMEFGYVTNASQGLDAYDGKFLNDGPVELYSLTDGEKLVIQGRSLPFDASDIVPLGFKTETGGAYSIAIDHTDGLFESNQAIILKDNLIGTSQDLKTAAYSFVSEIGTFDSRFEIVYTPLLSTHNAEDQKNDIIAYKKANQLIVHSSKMPINSIKVFDARGRLLVEQQALDTKEISLTGNWSQGILFVQITTEGRPVCVKKVLW